MKKVLIIVGPTASGKSDLSIKIAEKINGFIISGDSIQVYKGLDIGSAKISDKDKKGIIHYGIDILSNKDSYSVFDFQKMARNYIDTSLDKFPIIVGGTGLYIKSCIYDYNFSVNKNIVDDSLYKDKSNEELYDKLLKIDKVSASKIHVNNRKRIIRALMLAESGNLKSEIEAKQNHSLVYDAFIIGCSMDREILYERINKRVDKMFDDGLLDEVKNLLNSGVDFSNQCMQGIGYKEFKAYFSNEMSIDDVKSLIKKNTRNFAKKQYTWFNNQMDINWVNMLDENEVNSIIEKVVNWCKYE